MIIARVIFGLVVCLTAVPVLHAEQKPYTLEDLEALNKRQAWNEMIFHLQDVPPAARQGSWNRLVENACLRENVESGLAEYCRQELLSVLNSEPHNAAFAMKAGQWVRLNMRHWAAIPFFAKALKAPGDAGCKEEDVQMAILSGLGLPEESNKEIVASSRQLAFDVCWNEAKDGVVNHLMGGGGYFQANACPDLKKKNVLKGMKAATCQKV